MLASLFYLAEALVVHFHFRRDAHSFSLSEVPLVLGLFYLAVSVRFWGEVSDQTARRLLRASFVYLPAILALLLLNPLPK